MMSATDDKIKYITAALVWVRLTYELLQHTVFSVKLSLAAVRIGICVRLLNFTEVLVRTILVVKEKLFVTYSHSCGRQLKKNCSLYLFPIKSRTETLSFLTEIIYFYNYKSNKFWIPFFSQNDFNFGWVFKINLFIYSVLLFYFRTERRGSRKNWMSSR